MFPGTMIGFLESIVITDIELCSFYNGRMGSLLSEGVCSVTVICVTNSNLNDDRVADSWNRSMSRMVFVSFCEVSHLQLFHLVNM